MLATKITVLDPTAESTRPRFEMAIRPDRLEGKVLGIISNTKPGGDLLLEEIAQRLNERFHFGGIFKHNKSGKLGMAESALNDFSGKCDFVIVGVGD